MFFDGAPQLSSQRGSLRDAPHISELIPHSIGFHNRRTYSSIQRNAMEAHCGLLSVWSKFRFHFHSVFDLETRPEGAVLFLASFRGTNASFS